MALVYSCCFWFSLRLGGIIIGFFSLAIIILICSCIAHAHTDQVREELEEWHINWDLIYTKKYVESAMEDPQKYITTIIGVSCVYLVSCVMYVYGAYICNNLLMLAFIVLEFLRLILVSFLMATGLLLIKQNTMDIGFLIAASILVGFFLLGMFYLWLCAANLPVLLNEMERDEQAATIAKLQRLLEANHRSSRGRRYGTHGMPDVNDAFGNGVYVVRKYKGFDREVINGSKIPVM